MIAGLHRSVLAGLMLAALALCSCIFEEPVFHDELARPGAALEGLWRTDDADGPADYAALFPLTATTSMLQYPVATNGWWFEAQSLRVNDRYLLQLRILAGPEAKPAAESDKNYTLVWVEQLPAEAIRMRALDGRKIGDAEFTPAKLRAFLSDASNNWDEAFGEPTIFRRPPPGAPRP